ncbi:MAG: hypothetical protein E7381_00330 [Clostridiales bacterium]|nr:hypothetical protein [Clostridiales bacterium]
METIKKEEISPKQEKKANGLSVKVIWIIANLLLLIAFFAGFCSVKGKTITVLSVFDGLFDILSFKAVMWYYYLANFAHSVLYLTIGVKCVLKLKDLFFFFKHYEKGVKEVGAQSCAFSILKHCIVYFLLANILQETKITEFAFFACVMAIILFTIGKVLLELEQNKKISVAHLLKTATYFLVECLILILMSSYAIRPVVSGIIEGLDILFSYINLSVEAGWYTLYKILVLEIMYAVIFFYYCKWITSVFAESEANKIYDRKEFMSVSLIILVIDLIVNVVFLIRARVGAFTEVLSVWFTTASVGLLPLALLAIAGHLISYFPEFAKYKKTVVLPVVVEEEKTESERNVEE